MDISEQCQEDEDAMDLNKLYSALSSSSASQLSRKELEQYLSQPRALSNEDILL